MELWMTSVEWLARIILFLLVMLSVWSVAIIIERKKFFNQINVDEEFNELKTLIKDTKPEFMEQKSTRFFFDLQMKCSKGLAVLGTLGSTTPFIGLLGTVFGIIVAFGELSSGNVGTNSVMFALAEALILTAVGLIVAIPAVISFNIYSKKLKTMTSDLKSRLDQYITKES